MIKLTVNVFYLLPGLTNARLNSLIPSHLNPFCLTSPSVYLLLPNPTPPSSDLTCPCPTPQTNFSAKDLQRSRYDFILEISALSASLFTSNLYISFIFITNSLKSQFSLKIFGFKVLEVPPGQ